MKTLLTLEIYINSHWREAALIEIEEANLGLNSAMKLSYQFDYAIESQFSGEAPYQRIALNCPVDLGEDYYFESGFPLLFDLIPSGAARTHWIKKLNLSDGLTADIELLKNGAGNPPGNIRIKEAVTSRLEHRSISNDGKLIVNKNHPGFKLEDIVNKGSNFIEYAVQNEAYASGASDVQGVAPKFLFVQDKQGFWHTEGAIEESRIQHYAIIKFPRGSKSSDKLILETEEKYMRIAQFLGLNVANLLKFIEPHALLIPRFDRIKQSDGSFDVLGLESLNSLADIDSWDKHENHWHYLACLMAVVDDKTECLLEYVFRDIINITLGNKDNHGRNTAVLKTKEKIQLAPLYDFAPMYLDEEGIARVTRWNNTGEKLSDFEQSGKPNWANIFNRLLSDYPNIISKTQLNNRITIWIEQLSNLQEKMVEFQVNEKVIMTTEKTRNLIIKELCDYVE